VFLNLTYENDNMLNLAYSAEYPEGIAVIYPPALITGVNI